MDKLILTILIGTVLLLIGILSNVVYGEEDCGEWANCNMHSPSFDGVCCRICFIPELGYREWLCARVSDDVGFTPEEKNMLPQNFDLKLDQDIDVLVTDSIEREGGE